LPENTRGTDTEKD